MLLIALNQSLNEPLTQRTSRRQYRWASAHPGYPGPDREADHDTNRQGR